MGVVYKARQRSLNRVVALKVVLAGGHASISQRVRFLSEAEAVASLNHVGIVGVYEFGTWEEQPYMALEFCSGGSLADRLRGTPLTAREATVLAERLACAVTAAHERGIVHRDIKPANILITGDGLPKIADFGLAKMAEGEGITMTGAVLGTPSYMAPEQARGDTKTVGPAADVYALGALLYECLTGRPPFRGASPADTIIQSLSQEPVGVRALNPAVPVDLETICHKCLEKDPSRRYPSAQALADDLQRYLDGRPVLARPVGPLGRARRWVARNQVVTGLLVAVVVAVISGTTTTYLKYRDEAEQRANAVEEARAKDEALHELQRTHAKLEALSAEQTRTLERLTLEKAATEDALLRGMMRPLRNQHANIILLEETRALFDLAELPEERLRLRFVERGLASPEGSDKLAAWPQEVVGAVAGLDRDAAIRMRHVVERALRDPATSRNGKTACAFLVGVLPSDDVEVSRLAARVLAEQLATRPVAVLGELSSGLRHLTPRLTQEDASTLSQILVQRMAKEQDVVALEHLSDALIPLTRQLAPTDAATLAQPLAHRLMGENPPGLLSPISASLAAVAQRLTPTDAQLLAAAIAKDLLERVPNEKDSNAIASCSTALTALAKLLPPETEHALLGPPVRALAIRCVTEKDPNPIGNLSSALAGMAGRAASVDRLTAAKALADRSEAEKEPITLSNVASALSSLATRIPPTELKGFVKTLLARLCTETDDTARNYLAPPLADLVGQFPSDEAAAFVHQPILAIAERLAAGKDAQAVAEYRTTILPFCRYLNATDAASVAKLFVDRMGTEKDANALDALATSLLPLRSQLTPEMVRPLAKLLAERLAREKDGATTTHLAVGFMHLVERLPQVEATSLADAVGEAVVVLMLADKDPENTKLFAATLEKLAPGISPKRAAKLGKLLATRLASEEDTALCSGLALALAMISGRLSPDEEAALVVAPALKLANRLASAKEFISVNSAAMAINQLAPRLDPADAATAVKPIVDRMVSEREHAWHFLANGLWDVGARLNSADAAIFANMLMNRFAVEKDGFVLTTLSHTLLNLAPRLEPEAAAAVARGVALRMITEKDPMLLLEYTETFKRYTPQLSDQDLFGLLKSHVAFPPIRVSVLKEFGRRSGRTRAAAAVAGPIAPAAIVTPTFATVWDFLIWANQAHPELDWRLAPSPN